MFILEDAGQVSPQAGDGFDVWSCSEKFPSLPAKYRVLANRAIGWGADVFVVWDDDDIYLPRHLSLHAEALLANPKCGWSHPSKIWSLYTGSLELEDATGRFHGALAFTKKSGDKIGYWGDSTRCDYDQAIMGRLASMVSPAKAMPDFPLCHLPTYIYRWGSTKADHCSGRCKGPDDTTWYTDTPISQPGTVEVLVPQFDEETRKVYSHFGCEVRY
jgi:hypothetical protein